MPSDNLSTGLKPPASDENPFPGKASAASSRQPTPAPELDPYLLAVKSFKDGQDFSAKPSAYDMRRATETVDEDGHIGPAMTVKLALFKE
jgi:hypothetical protein